MEGRYTRRIFLRDVGVASVGLVVLGACSGETAATTTTAAPPATEGLTSTSVTTAVPATEAPVSTTQAPGTTAPAAEATWERVALGNVSAYVIVRGGEAAIVDTGGSGSVDAIGEAIVALGSGWDDVGNVILTHLHGDHVGSLAAVMEAAGQAEAHAGAPDIPSINSPRAINPVGDGDRVFDLEIIATPGHTAGHISVLDSLASVLIAGDALIGANGGVAGPVPAFTADEAEGDRSVVKLAGFDYGTVFFGHGDPVETNASSLVADLAAAL